MAIEIEFDQIGNAPLVVDAIYKGLNGKVEFDPLSNLMYCANRGGFRVVGTRGSGYKYIILYSSLTDPDWPDAIDYFNGTVTYYGDNKRPGSDLHNTPIGGNRILRDIFESLHTGHREQIPPVFMFTKGPVGRDVVFRGLLVPGSIGIGYNEDLVAIWKLKEGQRFQNYRAKFTILNISNIHHQWIDDLKNGNLDSTHEPSAWKSWISSESPPLALTAQKTVEYRTRAEQLPVEENDKNLLRTIYNYFSGDPYRFEKCAAEIVKLMDSNVISCDLTRRSRDGGRDAFGLYKIGINENYIKVDFSIEAKCYNIENSVGIKETSRLISRLRFRQFGILVTTSFVNLQAYKEIIEDEHPIIIISGFDIIRILKRSGIDTKKQLESWLNLVMLSK